MSRLLDSRSAKTLLDRLQAHLSPVEWERTQRIAALLQPPQHRAQVSAVLTDLFSGTTTDRSEEHTSELQSL